MEQWRAELQRKPLAMSEGQACEALGLTPGPDGRVEEDDMRRAYRALARRLAALLVWLQLASVRCCFRQGFAGLKRHGIVLLCT